MGVGECSELGPRFLAYIGPLLSNNIPARPNATLAHFVDPIHNPDYLELIPLESVDHLVAPAVLSAVLRRLECLWIRRLQPSLNIRRQVWASFSGGPDRRGDKRTLGA